MAKTQDLGRTEWMSRLELLRMARIGLQSRLEQIEAEIIGHGLKTPEAPKPATKRKMSAAGRKAIGDASRKRWKLFHAAQKKAKK